MQKKEEILRVIGLLAKVANDDLEALSICAYETVAGAIAQSFDLAKNGRLECREKIQTGKLIYFFDVKEDRSLNLTINLERSFPVLDSSNLNDLVKLERLSAIKKGVEKAVDEFSFDKTNKKNWYNVSLLKGYSGFVSIDLGINIDSEFIIGYLDSMEQAQLLNDLVKENKNNKKNKL